MLRHRKPGRRLSRPISAEIQVLENRCLLHGTMDPEGAVLQTAHDRIPNFAQVPTIVAQASGNWSDVSIWSEGRTPVQGDIIRISEGVTVVYDVVSDEAIEAIGVEGELRFATNQDTRLTVGTLLVYESGVLEVGSVDQPISEGVLAEILIADQPIDLVADPEQWGTGILGFGTVRMHGRTLNETFVRLASEPRVGDQTLVLEQAVAGWRVGDRLYLPDSHQRQYFEKSNLNHQGEYLEIAAISGDGLQISLTAPLQYNHLGARDADGNLDFLPHVANQTRNVQIRSVNPDGTRGHVAFFNRAEIDVRYAQFEDLGRTTVDDIDNATFDQSGNVTHIGTNQSGRYALHIHHLMGPTESPENGYQFTLIGNSLYWQENTQFKWGITLHGSHYGLIQQNIIQGANDSGIVTEDGSESFNLIEENFVADTWTAKGRMLAGAFWFRGFNNIIRNNVAVNVYTSNVESAYGFTFYGQYLGQIKIPAFPGADIHHGEFVWIDGNATPIREFSNNEVYASESGLTTWWLNAFGDTARNGGTTVISDLKIWHVHHHGYYGYPSNDVIFDGVTIRGDNTAGDSSLPMGFFYSDYSTRNNVIRNADIQGMRIGIFLPAFAIDQFRVEDTFLRNRVNVFKDTKWSVNGGHLLLPSTTILDNVRFEPLIGHEFVTIRLDFVPTASRNVIQLDQLFVYDYNGQADQDFQIFYEEQHPDFIVPQTRSINAGELPVIGSPEAGLTNTQNWQKYGIAIAGAVAPLANGEASHLVDIPEIQGALVFRIIDIQSAPIVVAPDAGQPGIVVVYDASGTERFRVNPYPGFMGGVRIAAGDVNGDGTPDIITAPGPGGGPHIKVFSGLTGTELASFFAFDPNFYSGVYVAVGDFAESGLPTGDTFGDIIVSADAGGGPRVSVFSSATGAANNRQFTPQGIQDRMLFNFFAYSPAFAGGVRVAAGDVTGDGTDDLIVGAGFGGGPHVQVFDGLTLSTTSVRSFYAYDSSFTSGIFVSVGNVDDNSPSAEIITGTGFGGGPHVRVFNVASIPTLVAQFFAYGTSFMGGVRVTAADVNGDEVHDIITAPGPTGGPHIRAFSGADLATSNPPADLASFFGYEGPLNGGLFIAGLLDADLGQGLRVAEGSSSGDASAALTEEDLDRTLTAALDRLKAAGLSDAELAILQSIELSITDLGGDLLGLTGTDGIALDVNAAGHGWFIDSTPDFDEEFLPGGDGDQLAAVNPAAVGRVDLLTVVLHELGHKLGLDDLPPHLHPDALMSATLPVGTRRLPNGEELERVFSDESLFESLLLV